MNTQISILVKNENIVSRFFSLMWIINIFKKMSVDIVIDDPNATPQRLKASSEPYLIDLAPGNHEILFTDPRAGGKAAFRAMTGAMLGAGFSGGAGGSFLGGAAMGADAAVGNSVKNGVLSFSLQEGDVLKVSAQPKRNGSVKVKILKDKN
jgi:hypothetical protein